jgi:phosphatidylinositol alpha-mannosyltransferase
MRLDQLVLLSCRLVLKSRMRIAQVCPYDIDRPGGVQLHVRDLAEALHRQGHDVTIFAPRPNRPHQTIETKDDRFKIVRLGVGHVLLLNQTTFEITYVNRADRREIDRLMAEEFDVTHYHTVWTPFLSWRIFLWDRAARVATFHDVPPDSMLGSFQRLVYPLILKWLLPHIDGVILTSRVLERHVDLTHARVSRILPPCTDLSRFHPRVSPIIQRKDGLINILFLSRVEPRKGVMVLLEAYRNLCHEGLPVRLLLVGDGPDRPAVEAYIARNKIPNVVTEGLGGTEDTPAWYSACDIFCAPSLSGEGFGIILVEAMASAKPVVAADNAGYRMLLSENTGQMLVQRGDPAELTDKLRELVLDASLRARMGEAGRLAAPRYDIRNVVDDFIHLYEEAIASHRARRANVSSRTSQILPLEVRSDGEC